MGDVLSRPRFCCLTRETTCYQFCRRLGELQGQSGMAGKILPSQEFRPRTVCPVASHNILKKHIYIVNVKEKVTSLSNDPLW